MRCLNCVLADKQLVFVVAVFVWTAGTVAAVLLGAGWAGVPMAYDVETQILGMDVKHDTGVTVKRVRSTKFPFFKESTVISETEHSDTTKSSRHTHNPVSNGHVPAMGSEEHDDTSEL